MFETMLVPLDGEPPSDVALDAVRQLAQASSRHIVLCHVVDTLADAVVSAQGFIDPAGVIENDEREGLQLLSQGRERLSGVNAQVDTVLAEGSPIEAILRVAAERGAELIVMGSHGRAGIARAILGSVTEGVLRKSPVPVLVVRAPAHSSG